VQVEPARTAPAGTAPTEFAESAPAESAMPADMRVEAAEEEWAAMRSWILVIR